MYVYVKIFTRFEQYPNWNMFTNSNVHELNAYSKISKTSTNLEKSHIINKMTMFE